jgi:hypothetical protein
LVWQSEKHSVTEREAIDLMNDNLVQSVDLNRDFDAGTVHFHNVPSLFVWNIDETGVGI